MKRWHVDSAKSAWLYQWEDGRFVEYQDFAALESRLSDAEAECERLREALRDAIKLIEHFSWENGNTDPSGSIDEGVVLTSRYVARLKEALARKESP